jgi:hypothetical protein
MGQVVLSRCLVTTEEDWIPVRLDDDLAELAIKQGTLQETQSKERGLNDRSVHKDPEFSLRHTILSKRSEYAVHQYYDRVPRVTLPGEFHDWPDVGQCNVRCIGDPTDGLMIQDRDQGELPMILTTAKDPTFKDQTIWLIGWGITDQLRRIFYLINLARENKNWGRMGGDFEDHEQFIYPRSMLTQMKWLSKEMMNTPYVSSKKKFK